MDSLIYSVSNNNRKGLGYSEPYEDHKSLNKKPKALYEQFVPSGTNVRSSEPTRSEGSRRRPQKRNKSSRTNDHVHIPFKYPAAKSPRLTRKDPDSGYLKAKLIILQISLMAPTKHLSWYLDNGCSRHMTGEKHLFQKLELKPGGVVGFGDNQKGKIIGSGTIPH